MESSFICFVSANIFSSSSKYVKLFEAKLSSLVRLDKVALSPTVYPYSLLRSPTLLISRLCKLLKHWKSSKSTEVSLISSLEIFTSPPDPSSSSYKILHFLSKPLIPKESVNLIDFTFL